jgi:hypothetical protein
VRRFKRITTVILLLILAKRGCDYMALHLLEYFNNQFDEGNTIN